LDRALYPSLRVLTAGGAPTPAEIIAELIDTFGVRGVVNSWGLTEFPIASCPSHTASPERLSATVGPPSPGVQVRIVEGELRLKGPQCFLGYVVPTLDQEAFDEDGWFRTGDLGTVDNDGYVTITGRRKDIIIRNGENLFPAEIEEVLLRHPAIADAAVVGMPDRGTGERVVAVVVPDTDGSVSLEDVRRHFARQGVAKQKTPEQLKIVNQIPRNPMGKALKEELKAAIDSGKSLPPQALPHPGDAS
jgi:cyclohexanecarboxylate-CoA ligase